ncbi:TatD family hydrolase [SAR92 clade bacterium H231]|jgi:TatD DNase family protein|nr:TatD family hydrolase [Porticoccaceae bacterium]MCT2532240.1 TatD family hydrolase [SAR92 clade bacterium H231]MDB2481246.1 TatD family hydrolase [Porticoccaceae bacterium]MDB2549126.1 TatD family hydrolase [Porticoccaceae bacterium]MDG1200373.1 TatD family hydrolase [Porticoccaceae bacterium]
MLVDSHCHLDRLDLSDRDAGLDGILADARARGITQFLSVAVDLATSASLVELTERYDHVYSSVGVHPLQKIDQPVPEVEQLVALARAPKVVAIGETGLDNFYSAESHQWQRDSFIRHLQASQQTGLPIIIHTRDAREETLELLRQYPLQAAGVMHCFTETWEMAEAAIELGFYISFSGIVTFKSADELREVVRRVPLDRILVETDSPWLAPVPHRGKQNEPQYVREVAETVADLKGVSLEQLAEITTQNFHRLFRIPAL